MPIPLIYEIGATGEDRIKRVLRGVEAEAKASASRVDTAARRVNRGRAGMDSETREARRGFDQIGRAARAADAQLFRQRMSHERAVARERERLDKRAQAQRERDINKLARAEAVAAKKATEAKIRTRQAMGRGVATGVMGGFSGAIGTATRVAGFGVGILGGIGAAGALDEEVHSRGMASALANQGGRPTEKGRILKEAGQVQGFTRQEALAGMGSFTDLTGELETARKILPSVAKMAIATNTSLADMMATAGNAWIPINDGAGTFEEKIKRLNEVVAALAGQGAVGAVEIKDLAKEFATLAATSNKFEGDRTQLMKKMGAITQAARQRGGADSAAEAVTAAARFSTDVTTKSKELKGFGVNVFDKTGTQLRDPEELIVEILKKTKGKLAPNTELFGERGIRAMQGFSPLFNAAEKKEKGSGEAAVRKEFKRLMEAELSVMDAEIRARSRLSDEDMKAKEAMKKFNAAVGERLIPLLTDLMPKFEELIPKVADLTGAFVNSAQFLIENPWKGLGILVGATIVKELTVAGIGSLVGGALAKIVAGASATLFGTGIAGTGALATGGAAVTAAGGLAVGATGIAAAAGGGAAVYNGYKLFGEVQAASTSGESFTDGLISLFKGPSRATTPEEYDRIYGREPDRPAASTETAKVDAEKASRQLEEGAAKAGAAFGEAAAAKLASLSPDTRRTAPLVAR